MAQCWSAGAAEVISSARRVWGYLVLDTAGSRRLQRTQCKSQLSQAVMVAPLGEHIYETAKKHCEAEYKEKSVRNKLADDKVREAAEQGEDVFHTLDQRFLCSL